MWFVWKIWVFLVAQGQKLGARGHWALLEHSLEGIELWKFPLRHIPFYIVYLKVSTSFLNTILLLCDWKFDLRANAPCSVAISQCLEKEGILDMARGNVHFQQQVWGYFAFKCLLQCSDGRSLPLVEKICDSMGFWAANHLRVDKVRTASCFSVFFTSYEWEGSNNNSQKNWLNQWIHTKKHRNTSKVSLLYLFYRKISK